MQLHLNPNYVRNAELVAATILTVQPRNGKPYDTEPHRRVREQIAVNVQWLADEARKNLAEDLEHVHPAVLTHRQKLADAAPPLAVN